MSIIEKYMELKGKNVDFLKPSISILYNEKLKGIDEGVSLIREHMDNNNKILNFSDYDCDLPR